MPARQRGSTVRRGNAWGARYYDETGARRFQGGFETKTEARDCSTRVSARLRPCGVETSRRFAAVTCQR
jgi:hypothetical protein